MKLRFSKGVYRFSLIAFLVMFIGVMLFSFMNTMMIESEINESKTKFQENAIKTEAIITDIKSSSFKDSEGNTQKSMDVYVKFEVDGVQYSGELNTYSITMKEGQKVTIYYNPDDPNDFRGVTPTGLTISKISNIVFEVVMFVIVIVLVVVLLKKRKSMNEPADMQ